MAVIRANSVSISKSSATKKELLKVKKEAEKLSKNQKVILIQDLVSKFSKEEQRKVILLLEKQIPTEEQEAQKNYSRLQYLKKRIADYQKLNSEEQKNTSSKLKGKGTRLIREKHEEFFLEIRQELQKLEGLPMMKACGNEFVWLSQEERTKEVEEILSMVKPKTPNSYQNSDELRQEYLTIKKDILENNSTSKKKVRAVPHDSKFSLYESETDQSANLFFEIWKSSGLDYWKQPRLRNSTEEKTKAIRL